MMITLAVGLTFFEAKAQWQSNGGTTYQKSQNATDNVGIGTQNAQQKLHVVGNTILDGNTTHTGILKTLTLQFNDNTQTTSWQPVQTLSSAVFNLQNSLVGLSNIVNTQNDSVLNSITGLSNSINTQNSIFAYSIAGLLDNVTVQSSILQNSILGLSNTINAQNSQLQSLNNGITFTGSKFDIYTPVQAQYNGNKPILSISQYGQMNFFSSPVLNYNAIQLKGSGDYNNGIRHGNNFGGTTNFEGPIIFGQNGGALGSSTANANWETAGTKTALTWNAAGNVKVHGELQLNNAIRMADGTVLSTAGGNWKTINNYLTNNQNVNILGELKMGVNSLHIGSATPASVDNYIYATDNDLDIYTQQGTTIGDIRMQKTSNRAVKIGGGAAGNTVNNSLIQLEVFSGARIHGTIQTIDVCITPNAFCDYVFDENYKLTKLTEIEAFIKKNKHLPEIPSEKEVVKNGITLNNMILLQMKKIEELTLYLIEQDKKIKKLEVQLNAK
ncbi:MAG: hypothetical protein EAZ53_04555 [Bacteroidetes bacterium]|nr:MAG: hypothetical protein EAZ53_04555 [Bacteroidota bacterium]